MRATLLTAASVAWLVVAVAGVRAAETTEDVEFRAAVDGTPQRYVITVPEGFAASKSPSALIALHGHGSDRWQFIKTTRDECRAARDAASKRSMLFISPDYRARTSWMGPKAEADLVQIIGDLKEKHRVEKVVICGASMGGTAVLTFAALHPDLVDGVVSMNGTANLVDYANFLDAIAESFGGTKAKVPDEYRRRSAEFFPEKFTMPVAATTGGTDGVVPPDSVLRLMTAVSRKNADALLVHRPQGGHATTYADATQALDFVLDKALAQKAPVPVKVEKTGQGWRLLRGGEPYFVRGVGGTGDRALLVRCGGNSVRTWGTEGLGAIFDDESGKLPYLPTGWMGNTKGLKLDAASTDRPHAGKTCVRIDFTPNDGWGGIVWQSPANDWGDRPGGWDLTGAKTLSFHARGAVGGEVFSVEFGLLKDKKYSDTGRGKLEKITLTPEWTRHEIKLDGQDLGRIKTGFAVIVAGQGKPVTAYFDDIRFTE